MMNKTRKRRSFKNPSVLILSFGLICSSLGISHASKQSLDEELDTYIETFSANNFADQRKAIEPLGWSGITSSRLYDVIAEKLLSLKNADSKVDKEKASWFAKALALSGNEKYQSTLEDVATNAEAKKVRKYANVALTRLPKYIVWNPVIAQGLATSKYSIKEQRVRNMLAASDLQLFRLGAKRVYHAHASNDQLVALVKERLVNEYQSASDKDSIDAMAWAIKVLAQSGDSAHAETLEEIASNAKEKKIRKYAKKYQGYF